MHVIEKNLKELADLEITFITLDSEQEDRKLVCVFFSDDTFDTMGEMLKVQTRLKQYDTMTRFRGFASEIFE